jgi:hypothetical protein
MRVLKKELWPYRVSFDVEQTQSTMYDVETWLEETIGSFKDRWNAVYKSNGTDFYFRRGKDATLFTLRWSS